MAAAKDREMLALIDTMASLEDRERLMGLLREALTSPGAMARAVTAYGLLDALADADPDEEAAHALAECIPRELLPPSDPTSSDDSHACLLRRLRPGSGGGHPPYPPHPG